MKMIFISLVGLVFSIAMLAWWFYSLMDHSPVSEQLKKTVPSDLDYLSQRVDENRGKVLVVVSSVPKFKKMDKRAGYELTELARAYYVFLTNGFEMDVASPLGGKPPARIDWGDMGPFDYAFLNDKTAQAKVKHSLSMAEVKPQEYQAVYFVGGKGAMFDFPDNPHIQTLVRDYYEQGKVIGAVCHGPAALINVSLSNGDPLVSNKVVTAISNQEDLMFIKDAEDQFPFLLESKLREQGARYQAGPDFLNHISENENLITGQNPWSVWAMAETMITKLGYVPVPRRATSEENAIAVLGTYEADGYARAKAHLNKLVRVESRALDRNLIAMHGILSLMKKEVKKTIDLIKLLNTAKGWQEGVGFARVIDQTAMVNHQYDIGTREGEK